MAHFAKIGLNSKVLQVLTCGNKDLLDSNGKEDERLGQQHLEKYNHWPAQLWVQTSYNTSSNTHKLGGTPFRGNYAGIGYEWDEDNQIFWPKSPYPSWVKNTTTAEWESPSGPPPVLSAEDEVTHQYIWDESAKSWNKVARF